MKTSFITLLFSLIIGINISSAQTYFFEDFENGIDHWNLVDYNNDGRNWISFFPSGYPDFGTKSLYSRSISATPDNLAISPAIDLSNISLDNGTYLSLEYQYVTYASLPAEKYSLYITTSSNPDEIVNSTPIFTETVQTGGVIVHKKIDISNYVGQTVYLTFRHYDCSQYSILLDNIEVVKMGTNNVRLKNYKLDRYIFPNQDTLIELELSNEGDTEIQSVTLNWNDGTNDHISIVPINIQPNETISMEHPIAVNYSNIAQAYISIIATHVNGDLDFDPTDNVLNAKINTISQSIVPKTLIEVGTGTWCGWCPRGIVAMKYMDENYADSFIGIAVHDRDVLENEEHASNSNFAGFPIMHVDRTLFNQHVSTESMEEIVNARSERLNPASLQSTTTLTGNELSIDVSSTFYSNFSDAKYRFGVIITEDNLQGYGQTNYYAGGGNGPMGGFENLPEVIPPDLINHDHVARALIGGYAGQENSIPTNIFDGQTISYTFNYTIPEDYNIQNLNVIAVIIDNDNGQIVNSKQSKLGEMSVDDVVGTKGFSIYPNPANEVVNLINQQAGRYSIKIYDLTGKTILNKNQKYMDKNQVIPVSTSNLSNGIYLISLEGQNQSFTKKLIIRH